MTKQIKLGYTCEGISENVFLIHKNPAGIWDTLSTNLNLSDTLFSWMADTLSLHQFFLEGQGKRDSLQVDVTSLVHEVQWSTLDSIDLDSGTVFNLTYDLENVQNSGSIRFSRDGIDCLGGGNGEIWGGVSKS